MTYQINKNIPASINLNDMNYTNSAFKINDFSFNDLSKKITEEEKKMYNDILKVPPVGQYVSNTVYTNENSHGYSIATTSQVNELEKEIDKIKKSIKDITEGKTKSMSNNNFNFDKSTIEFSMYGIAQKDIIEGETKTMNNSNFNFNLDFGPVDNKSAIKYSMYGIALMDAVTNNAYAYNYADDTLMDVTGMVTNPNGILYKMPIDIHDVQEGMYILTDTGDIICVEDDAEYTGNGVNGFSLREHRMTNYYPAENIFGTNYVTRIINLMEDDFNFILDDKMFMFMLMNNANGNNNVNNNLLSMFMLAKDGVKPAIDKKFLMMMCMNNNNNDNNMLPLLMAMKK